MTCALHTELIKSKGVAPTRLALVLHGVFGSGANWRMFMRALVALRPDWGFVLCDLRGHARSQGAEPPHDLDAMADDLAEVARGLDAPVAAVIGHSLGGKVALAYASRAAAELEQVWVLDSQPGARAFEGMTVEVLELLESLPRVFTDRSEFVERVVAAGQSRPIASWLAMNVRREANELVLQLDLPVLRSVLDDYYRTDLWEVLTSGRTTHMVVGTKSFVWSDEDLPRLDHLASQTPSLHVHRLVGAGHWVNVDAAEELRDLFVAHL